MLALVAYGVDVCIYGMVLGVWGWSLMEEVPRLYTRRVVVIVGQGPGFLVVLGVEAMMR